MKLIHVITCLEMGGAETMLHRLLAQLDRAQFQSSVISLAPAGPMAEPIRALGFPVMSLEMQHAGSIPLAVQRLAGILRQERPAVVQTWMYHADLLGGLAARLAGGLTTIWNIRHGALNREADKRSTFWLVNACGRLSRRLPERIICCSRAAQGVHAARGYDASRMVLIPNGFDVDTFRPDVTARLALRQELGLAPDTPIVGLVARYDPAKDHRTFLRAAARLHQTAPNVHFVLCGDNIDWRQPELVKWIDQGNLRGQCHLLGRRHDVQRLQASFDVAALTSLSEGFPNVIGEAMACGVPCVATDVGDAAWIVGETGRIVPPRDPQALAAAWDAVLTMPSSERQALGEAARARIVERFALPAAIERYAALYRDVARNENEVMQCAD